jgi:membrane protein YqaA with SNARE-associated domain
MTDKADLPTPAPSVSDDRIAVRWWFLSYVLLATAAVVTTIIFFSEGLDYSSWSAFKDSLRAAPAAPKLIVFALYLSVCTTFLPLNTSWIVSAVAMQDVAVTGAMWSTVLLVAVVGAAASTVANLNDYHLFTLLLRNRRIARVRDTRTYHVAVEWFARSPFAILLVFNLIPIPVDVARLIAVTHRYPRWPFAAANFIGRFIRYAIIAAVTYQLAEYGWVATVSLVALAVVMALGRVIYGHLKKRSTT